MQQVCVQCDLCKMQPRHRKNARNRIAKSSFGFFRMSGGDVNVHLIFNVEITVSPITIGEMEMWWWLEYLFKVVEMLESVAYQYVFCMCSLYVPMHCYLV